MKKTAVFILCIWAFVGAVAQEKDLIRRDVEVLASDSLEGRKFNTAGSLKAQNYILNAWEEAGIETVRQDFYFMDNAAANIVGLIPSSVPSNEYIVVGAHYDHLGIVKKRNQKLLHPWADDNASGTAVLLSLAREFSKNKPSLKRNIVLVAFDAEEVGLYGSKHFASNPPYMQNLNQPKLMINLDMVGWLWDGELTVEGVGMLENWDSIFAKTNKNGIKLAINRFDKHVLTDSDFSSFAKEGVPALSITTGTKSPYHKPEDTAEKLDYEGLEKISGFVYSLVCEAANAEEVKNSGKAAKRFQARPDYVSFGLNANVGSTFQNYHFGNVTGRAGYSYGAGAFLMFNISKYFSISTGAEYQRERLRRLEGARVQEKIFVPLQFVFQTPLNDNIGVAFSLGAYYDWCFSAQSDVAELKLDAFPRYDFGLSLGYELRIGSVGLCL